MVLRTRRLAIPFGAHYNFRLSTNKGETNMRKRLALAFCVFFVSTVVFAQSKKAIVLDTDSKSVAVVDVATGAVGERVTLSDTPLRMILSPDNKRIAVLSRGEGTTSFWTAHFNPTSKSSVTLIDASTMKQIARTELGWDVGRAAFSADGTTLTVLTPGVSGKPAEVKPAELIRLNAKSGEVLKRAPLDRAAESFETSSNASTAAIFLKSVNKGPAELRLIDLGSLETAATITLPKDAEAPFALINDQLYLRDTSQHGKVYVVSLNDRKVAATLEAGENPHAGAVDPERGNIYLISSNGEMRVLHGTTLSAPVAVAKAPVTVRFSDDKKTAYVVSWEGLTVVDLTKMTASAPIEVRKISSDFVASPDGRRGFVFHGGDAGCCWATVVDLTSNTNMKSFMTGSKGARIAQGLAAVAATAASYQSGRSTAQSHGGGTFYYSVYTPRIAKAARGPLAMRPDGKFAYFLDAQTSNVTIVDGESGERLQNIGVGGGAHELVMLANGKYVAAVSDDKVTIIDTESNQMKSEIKLAGDVADFAVSPKSDYAAVIGKGKIAIIDARTASQVTMIESFKRPAQFVFLD
jgi:DNA-binding beta-propeller fold protein YncE